MSDLLSGTRNAVTSLVGQGYYKVATASEPQTFTWNFSSSKAAAGGIKAIPWYACGNPYVSDEVWRYGASDRARFEHAQILGDRLR